MNTLTNITQHHESARSIGIKQWELLGEIENKYKNADVSAFLHSGSFLDPIWHPRTDTHETINFSKLFPSDEYYPLALLCRVACYKLIVSQGYAVSTVFSGLTAFCSQIVKSRSWDKCMASRPNQPFQTLGNIESEFYTNVAQSRLAEKGAISATPFNFVNNIFKLSLSIAENAFISGMDLPWVDQGITVETWLEQQRQLLGIVKEESFYAPLEFEAVSNIVKCCMPIITEYRETIEAVFDSFTAICNDHTGKQRIQNAKTSKRWRDTVETHAETLNLILPIRYAQYTKAKEAGAYKPIESQWTNDFFELVQSACAWMVLLTTGLRNSDMRGLRVGCCKPSSRLKNFWWLVTDVRKTKNRLVIPVAEPTFFAAKLLEKARILPDSKFLISSPINFEASPASGREYSDNEYGMIKRTKTFNGLLRVIPEYYGFSIPTMLDDDSDATAHCVRATLAGYIAQNSNAAILILKRLFGHSNALMPNQYIYRNPLVIQKRKELAQRKANELARDLAHAVTHKKVAGKKGDMLLAGAENIKTEIRKESELRNESLTEMDMLQTLENRLFHIFHDDISNGETYALLTPMAVVCMRACNNTGDSPCSANSNNQARQELGIKKAITDALASLPNPAQCVGASCGDALIGSTWSQQLLTSFDYFLAYRERLDGVTAIKEEAKAFISTYRKPLSQVYGDERAEGYFDAE